MSVGTKVRDPWDGTDDRASTIIDPDRKIFRIAKWGHLLADIDGQQTYLAMPSAWDDPLEDQVTRVAVRFDAQPAQQFFLERTVPRAYAQCWSLTGNSDGLWRSFSRFATNDPSAPRNIHVDEEGVQLSVLLGDMFAALSAALEPRGYTCFVGRVRYGPREQIFEWISGEVYRLGRSAFDDPVMRARSLLVKQASFAHEDEVRFLAIATGQDGPDGLFAPVDLNTLYRSVTPDPRLITFERIERENALRDRGMSVPVEVNDLYQKFLNDIRIAGEPR